MVNIIVLICEFALYIYYAIVTYGIMEYPAIWKIVIILLMIICANGISSIVHECGHLIGGLLSKHKLLSIQLGYLRLFRNKGSFYLGFSQWDNQCIMVPNKKAPAFTLYQMGGVLLNFIFALILSYIGYYHLVHGSLVFLFVCALITASICKIAGNGIPIYKKTYPVNDMAYEKILEKDRITREEYYLYLHCLDAISKGEDIGAVKRPYSVQGKDYYDLFWKKILELQGVSQGEIK